VRMFLLVCCSVIAGVMVRTGVGYAVLVYFFWISQACLFKIARRFSASTKSWEQ